jgi:asparagine synthase (glutamine-hydrolysing)
MCGICGAFALSGDLDPAIANALPAMTQALAHRGPDGEGYYTDRRVAIGHRRLSIIDRTGGAQPMQNEDGTCWITFNGEIYNHKDIRRRLAGLGHTFRTHSDTETIVHAYEQFGPACTDHLEGMFAFAIYDGRAGTLFLARDRIGKKPLYYAIFNGVFHFASEIKAIAESPYWDDRAGTAALEGYLSLGYFVAPETPFEHVRQLPAAHWLMVKDGQIAIREYWDIPAMGDSTADARTVLRDLDGLLESAVNDRLETEVRPLGAFLSGGIDSGLIVSYVSQGQRTQLVTVSVGFDSADHNELQSAALSARHCRTVHHEHIVRPRVDEVLDPILRAFDEPFADSSAIPTYYLCRTARQHVTVALSGDGGDESFAGYDFRYKAQRIEGWIRENASDRLRTGGARALSSVWPRWTRLPRGLRLGTLFDNLAGPAEDAYYADLCFLKPTAARALLGIRGNHDPRASAVFESVVAPFRRWPSASLLQRVQYADLKVYLPNGPLVKVDRMSMWHGLEVRCPMLDRRVVEFAFRQPTVRTMPGLRGKFLLRSLAQTRLPEPLWRLPKRGFSAPVGSWLAGEFAGPFRDEVMGTNSFVNSVCDGHEVKALFEQNRARTADHGYALWALWMLERWRMRYARRGTPSTSQGSVPPHATSVVDQLRA